MSAITVKIVRSEKREVDELDTKPFTMYVLEVSAGISTKVCLLFATALSVGGKKIYKVNSTLLSPRQPNNALRVWHSGVIVQQTVGFLAPLRPNFAPFPFTVWIIYIIARLPQHHFTFIFFLIQT